MKTGNRLVYSLIYVFYYKESFMTNVFLKKNLIQSILFFLTIALPTYVVAAKYIYSSLLVNQSKHSGSNGFKLVRTKVWPNSVCVIDMGKQIVNPGESTELKIKKNKECRESGVGYSIYKIRR